MSAFAQRLTSKLRNHYWADWVGALFFTASAAVILSRASEFSILLLPIIAHGILAATSFLIWRTAPKRQSIKWYARAAAYGATFAVPILVAVAHQLRVVCLVPTQNTYLCAVGSVLWIFGSLYGLRALWSLRRSFSIEPEARDLRTDGPYRIARHPIYACHILQYTGVLLLWFTVPLGLICLFWFVLMYVRVRFEEQVLRSAFPDYEAYCRKVGMFGPRLLQRASTQQLENAPSHATAEACLTQTH